MKQLTLELKPKNKTHKPLCRFFPPKENCKHCDSHGRCTFRRMPAMLHQDKENCHFQRRVKGKSEIEAMIKQL